MNSAFGINDVTRYTENQKKQMHEYNIVKQLCPHGGQGSNYILEKYKQSRIGSCRWKEMK